jgi:hypothetical protein
LPIRGVARVERHRLRENRNRLLRRSNGVTDDKQAKQQNAAQHVAPITGRKPAIAALGRMALLRHSPEAPRLRSAVDNIFVKL